MIVRILGESQYEVDDAKRATLDELDQQLSAAIDADDAMDFKKALGALVAGVRAAGNRVDPSRFVPSDLTVPHEGTSLEELRDLLESEDSGEI